MGIMGNRRGESRVYFVLLRDLDGREPLFIDDHADRDRLAANLTVFGIILLFYGAVDEKLDRLAAIRTHAVDRFHAKRRHTPPQRHYTLTSANKATPTLHVGDGIVSF
jgi:hypothetical protein